jgi:hypothetical protein
MSGSLDWSFFAEIDGSVVSRRVDHHVVEVDGPSGSRRGRWRTE